MDFEPTDVQDALSGSLAALLDRHAGVERARAQAAEGAYDLALEHALRDAGFFDLFGAADAGPLDATLAVEQISAELGAVTPVPHLLVLPALGLEAPVGAVVLAMAGSSPPARYGHGAVTMVTAGPDVAEVVQLDAGDGSPLPSVYGHPLARLTPRPGATLGPGSGPTMVDWWRIGVSAEAVGLMGKALAVALQYAKDRQVFGRSVGSFQALQHRLAECSVHLEGARWLVYEAAAHGAPAEAAATAAAHTMSGLDRLTRETHQIMGAIGLTQEHDLHLWTFRMQAVRAELGGLRAHRQALAESRWG